MKPKGIILIIIYMLLIYTTVHVFSITAVEDFRFGGSETLYDDMSKDGISEVDHSNQSIWESFVNWLGDTIVGKVFGVVWDGINYAIEFLTFGSYRNNIVAAGGMPSWLAWIPTILVLPVWICIIYWLLPYMIAFIRAIGSWIPFT